MAEKICRGEHSCHLCMLASLEKIDKIKELAKHPRFICFICGVALHSSVFARLASGAFCEAIVPLTFYEIIKD